MTEIAIPKLLKLAGVPPSDKAAVAWLSEAIADAQHIYAAAQERPLPADHNSLLADIEKSAKELSKRIERLRRHPASSRAFWRSSAFGPVHLDRLEVPAVLSAIENILRAANSAKDRRQGRRREAGKQHVVDLAIGFFERFSPHRPSGTPTGATATFAREFYSAVIGLDPEQHGGLDRQIRQAARSFIRRQPAQRKSVKKSKVSS